MDDVHYSSDRQDWCTPPEVMRCVYKVFEGQVDLDPCSNKESIVAAITRYEEQDDGLSCTWQDHSTIYVNPPYGRKELPRWVDKCIEEVASNGCEVIALLPARPDSKAWFRVWDTAQSVCFIRGRLQFLGAPSKAPFPSALIYWGNRRAAFMRHMSALGRCLEL